MLNLNDLQLFVKVIDHGGFTAAARALRMPKQTLSKRLGVLEEQAGVRLIQRTSRRFSVTELGRELYRHAAAMVVEADAAQDVILGRLAEPSGTVRITASVPTVQSLLAGLLPRAALTHPRIHIELQASDRFVDVVQEGFDLALRTHATPLPDSGLVQRQVAVEALWLVASPTRADLLHPVDPAQLDGVDGVLRPQSDGWLTLTDGKGAQRLLRLRPRYSADEGSAILAAATAGLGVAVLPSSMCTPAIASGALHRLLPSWTAGAITTTLLMPHRRGMLPAVRAVADLITGESAAVNGL